MIELGVNIDHVATIRQARRTYEPDPVWAAVEAHLGGADGITVHLREDRRHIQDEDVRRLRELVHIKLNLEMAATAEMVDIATRLKPEMAMLVPEGRHEITTEGGLDVRAQEAKLREAVKRLAGAGHPRQRLHRRRAAAGRGCSAHRRERLRDPHRSLRACVPRRKGAIRRARRSWRSLPRSAQRAMPSERRECASTPATRSTISTCSPWPALPGVRELHIGHAIVSRAVFVGMREAVRQMKALLREAAVAGGEGMIALPRGPVFLGVEDLR